MGQVTRRVCGALCARVRYTPDASGVEQESVWCVSMKASRQSTLGYTHGSSLSVDGVQTMNSMVTQDTDKLFIQVRPPCGRNTYVLRLIVLD